jgi:hypothetical protein
MEMRRRPATIFAVGLVMAAVLAGLAGCGKGGEPTGEVDGYVYVPVARGETSGLVLWPDAYAPPERGPGEIMPVEGARIMVEGTSVQILTNADGYFKLKGLKPGRYTIAVKYGELAPLMLIVDVIGNHATHCDTRPAEENGSDSSSAGASQPAVVATQAFANLVLAREQEPNSGRAIAELASGTDLENASTVVRLPDEAAQVAAQYQQEVKGLLLDWNRTVLAARREVGMEEPVPKAVSVLRDRAGLDIMRVETAAQD